MAETNSRVFVINEPRATRTNPLVPNVSPALKFGSIVTVFSIEDHPMPSEDPDAALNHAEQVMDDVTEDDYLLFAGGDVWGIAFVLPFIMDRCDRIRILKWDFKERGYVAKWLDFGT